MNWPFGNLPMFGFDVVVADPPWLFDLRSSNGEEKSPQGQYDCLPSLEIRRQFPVGNLVGVDSWLFLWATAPLLPTALQTMHAWGFEYRTRIAWRKTTRNGKVRVGPGYVVRTMHEDVLIGAIGQPKYRHALPSIFDGLAREHSRKPDEFYRLVERFAPNARRADLFSRETRPGWTSWGAEAGKVRCAPGKPNATLTGSVRGCRMIPRLAILLAFAASMASAAAHSWYPRECCHDRDCRPAECSDFTPVDRDGLSTYRGKRVKIRPSEDGGCHICLGEGNPNMAPICGFLPGTS